MDWMKKALGISDKADKVEKHKDEFPEYTPPPGMVARPIFGGDWKKAEGLHPDVTDGIQKLINFCLNMGRPDGERAFAHHGEKVVFQVVASELGVRDKDGNEVSAPFDGGNFEIEVRRVR